MMSTIKAKILTTTGRGILLATKYSPEILVGVGVTSMIGCAIFAHEAKPKAIVILNNKAEALDQIERAKVVAEEDAVEYSPTDIKKDTILAHRNAIVGMAKVYAPTIITGALGVTSILCAFGIIKRRNLALIGAYKLISKSYDNYRSRVVEKYGAEEDRAFKHGIKKCEEGTIDENGEIQSTETEIMNPTEFSDYARLFDETSVHWSKIKGYNLLFAQAQQDYAKDLLVSRGHLFLSEVYDMFDIKRTPESALVGWIYGDNNETVDFGIFTSDRQPVQDFKDGTERSIFMDFNVQGIMYDLI